MWLHKICPLVIGYLNSDDFASLGEVSRNLLLHVRSYQRWTNRPKLRCLTDHEVQNFVLRLKAAHIGPRWAVNGTVDYMHNILPTIVEFPENTTPETINAYMEWVVKLYRGCMVVPNTSVGALDTTRTIERLTQARLSRFHTTGAVHVSFLKSGSLDSMLHPLSTAATPRMLVALRASHSDTSTAAGVIESIRGVLVNVELSHTVEGQPRYIFSTAMLPAPMQRLCHLVTMNNRAPCCLAFTLRNSILFDHRIAPHSIAYKINKTFDGIVAMVLHCMVSKRWVLYVAIPALEALGHRSYMDVLPEIITQLPAKDACQDVTVNVIFDTGSTGIPQKLKHCMPCRSDIDGIMQFLQYRDAGGPDRSASVRVTRRRAVSSAAQTLQHGFAVRAGSATRNRRRCFSGARNPRNDATSVSAGNTDRSRGQKATEMFVANTVRWFGHVFSQVLLSFEANISLREDSGIPCERLESTHIWRAEAKDLLTLPGGVTNTVLAWRRRVQDPLLPMHTDPRSLLFVLENTLMRCLYVFANVPATSGRTELLAGVLNETVYHACGRLLAQPYMQYRISARLLVLSLCGLEGVRSAVASHNTSSKEWVVLTEGSAFSEFIDQSRLSPQLDVHNSTTTSIPEIAQLLGIEACHYLFTNGNLADSLGVNNHCCKLLSSHISRGGVFRGVNRTQILNLNSPLDAITVEDPAKHIRDAAVVGAKDNCKGSSANILLGKSVRAGTAAFDLHYSTSKPN